MAYWSGKAPNKAPRATKAVMLLAVLAIKLAIATLPVELRATDTYTVLITCISLSMISSAGAYVLLARSLLAKATTIVAANRWESSLQVVVDDNMVCSNTSTCWVVDAVMTG
jgi:hypothetical protein